MPAAEQRLGRWAEGETVSEKLIAQLSGVEDALQKEGSFWEAVKFAHHRGNRGDGKKVAVLDGGFFLEHPGLADRVELGPGTSNKSDHGATHGTAVALLVREVAPEATLLLYDIGADGSPSIDAVVEALRHSEDHADVICCSFVWDSDPRRVTSEEVAELLDLKTGPEVVSKATNSLLKNGFPWFDADGCQQWCVLCQYLSGLTADRPLIIAAGGNSSSEDVCPAAHHAAVSAGFRREYNKAYYGSSALKVNSAPSSDQHPIVDVSLKEIPGAIGTSFAAPLLSGFACLVGIDDFKNAVLISHALDFVIMRHMETQRLTDEEEELPPDAQYSTLVGYYEIIKSLPAGHDWDDEEHAQQPCALCSFFFARLWQTIGLMYLESGNFAAARDVLRHGRSVAPASNDIRANYARSLRELSETESDTQLGVYQALTAAENWVVAADEVTARVDDAREAVEHAVAISNMAQLPPLPSEDELVPEGGVSHSQFNGWGEEHLRNFSLAVQHMTEDAFAPAIELLLKLVEETEYVSAWAKLHLGVAYQLEGSDELALTWLERARQSKSPRIVVFADFNLRRIRRN